MIYYVVASQIAIECESRNLFAVFIANGIN
jgi:hypothetical protein